jgi:hypothetical protein
VRKSVLSSPSGRLSGCQKELGEGPPVQGAFPLFIIISFQSCVLNPGLVLIRYVHHHQDTLQTHGLEPPILQIHRVLCIDLKPIGKIRIEIFL